MSEIFISYKREDEARVVRLVRALEGARLSVWWDRSLPGGESWRGQIQNALDAAKCVIVVWTHGSIGPAGDFVRDEAAQAKRRGILVPVRLDKIDPPLGFGEIQAIDLTHWKGSTRDPFFQDLRSAVAARLAGRPVPPAQGPTRRLIRRLTWSSLASAALFSSLAFGLNLFRLQDHLCAMPLLQPGISDVCGSLGFGNRPTRPERIAWAAWEPGSCAALKTHIERFPGGVYHDRAASLLAARHVTQTETWTPVTRRLVLVEPQGDVPFATEAAAHAAALAQAQVPADRLCKGFAAATLFRFRSAMSAPQAWHCNPMVKGIVCGFEGEAVCELDERQVQENETCGK
jgi:TIR domain